MRDSAATQPLEPEACMELLASEGIGRVILTEQAMPTALPVAYAVDHGTIVFRSSAGTKLAAAVKGTVIAFEVDSFDVHERAGWSVVVTGLASVVEDPEDERSATDLRIPNWVEPDGGKYIRLRPSIVTGRRVGSAPTGPPQGAPAR